MRPTVFRCMCHILPISLRKRGDALTAIRIQSKECSLLDRTSSASPLGRRSPGAGMVASVGSGAGADRRSDYYQRNTEHRDWRSELQYDTTDAGRPVAYRASTTILPRAFWVIPRQTHIALEQRRVRWVATQSAQTKREGRRE